MSSRQAAPRTISPRAIIRQLCSLLASTPEKTSQSHSDEVQKNDAGRLIGGHMPVFHEEGAAPGAVCQRGSVKNSSALMAAWMKKAMR